MLKKFLIPGLLTLSTSGLFAQFTDEYFLTDIVPPSPEASALGKYAEQPVDLFSGKVKVEIPLFTVETGRIKVPISLSYHGSGVKVEEIGSRVGIGWTLNAGGVITRSVVGFKDDLYHFEACPDGDYSQDRCEVVGYLRNQGGERITYLDQGPDKYFYNFPGGTGGFYFGKDQSVKKTSFNNYLIEPTFSGYSASRFKITDDDGIIYTFDVTETTRIMSIDLPLDIAGTAHYSSWYLSEIYDPITDRRVTFKYRELTTIELDEHKSETFKPEADLICGSLFGLPSSRLKSRQQNHLLDPKVIDKIVYDQGRIEFTSNVMARQDLPGDYAITRIEQFDRDNNRVGRFDLKYSHSPARGISSKHKRLVLDQVQQVGKNGSTEIPPYEFSYYKMDLLPHRESVQKDIWGFYNANGAISYKPKIWVYEGAGKASYLPIRRNTGTATEIVSGSNRNCNAETVKYGSLTKVKFPTGGYVEYEYEPHVFYHRENGVFQANQEFTGGGIRIKSVRHYTSPNELAKTTTYSYHNGFTSGSIPQAGVPTRIVSNGAYDDVMVRYDRNMAPLGSNTGVFVGYEKVVVKNENESGHTIGSTEYIFNTIQNELPGYTNNAENNCASIIDHLLNTSYWPFHDVIDRSPLMGQLLSEKVKNESGQLVKEINYIRQEEFKSPHSVLRSLGTIVQDASSHYVESSRTTSEQISLLKKKSVGIEGSSTDFSKTEYQYDNKTFYLSKEVTTGGEGKETIRYYYPNDFSSSLVCSQMIARNYLSPKIVRHKFRQINGIDHLVESSVFEFKNFDRINKILPHRLYHARVSTPLATTPDLNYGANPPAIQYDLYHEYSGYSTHSKLSAERTSEGIEHSYLWTYDYTYPSVRGINISSVSLEHFHKSASAITTSRQGYESHFRSLLTSDQQVQFFYYDPLVGMIRITDTNGYSTTWDYDEFNRMIRTKDTNSKVTSEFTYHFGN